MLLSFSAGFIVPQLTAQGDGIMGVGPVRGREMKDVLKLDAADKGMG